MVCIMEEKKKNRSKTKPELKITFEGEPSVESLSKAEQKVFFETLLNRIIELKQKKDELNQSSEKAEE